MPTMRDRIRDAALSLFIKKGYARTSIAEIERSVGLAPRAGGFYRHFPSKIALAVEIGEKSIIESRQELGLDVLPLGDTRAELVLIAKGYMRAAERQAPLAALIAEVSHLEQIRDLERRVSADLLSGLTEWLAGKPCARHKTGVELCTLVLCIFGGWFFYLTKRDSPVVPELTDDRMLSEWADLWTGILDAGPVPAARDES